VTPYQVARMFTVDALRNVVSLVQAAKTADSNVLKETHQHTAMP
jgi:hypothetical protein